MLAYQSSRAFSELNRAYGDTFKPDRLTVGLVVPIERYADSAIPTMDRHLERARLAEQLGFSALWLRDVPFHVPLFGDAGQMFDPFVYLGVLAGATERIALGTASIILPLRHPAHVAKAAASTDVLSQGRLLLGVASGDRPEEYPALKVSPQDRSERFRNSYDYMRRMADDFPAFENSFGRLAGEIDMLPKPVARHIPTLITGGSRQSPDWIARNGDGWMTYPRDVPAQARAVEAYRDRLAGCGEPDKPVMQSLYIDLVEDRNAPPRPIHLGFRSGTTYLKRYLKDIASVGINHVALNLRFNSADTENTLKTIADDVVSDIS